MAADGRYLADVEAILSHRHDNGADFWATPDGRVGKGAPFSTLECAEYLAELGVDSGGEALRGAAALIWDTWREDGRFRVYPGGGGYPCQTAAAAVALCRLGYAGDPRLAKTCRHLLDTRYADGGWRCNKFSFGRGPETEHSNPHPTLMALDVFRCLPELRAAPALDAAVDFLLEHWVIRKPIGPCHYGMGTLFMQVEYPFRNYNLFYYVYVLSFYPRARADARFREALAALEGKLSDGRVVVERAVPKLAKLSFCQKGAPSPLATARYREIVANMALQ